MNIPIEWTVTIDPSRALLRVACSRTWHDGERFFLPAWIPGSYLIREFARGIQDLRLVDDEGNLVALERWNKASWRVRVRNATHATLQYELYGHELSVRSAHVDATHAFFNGANAFVAIEGHMHHPHHVRVHAPETWMSFVSLLERDGAFIADDYERLADTAFEIGPHPYHVFEVDGVPHRLIVWGDQGLVGDLSALEDPVRAIILQNKGTFDAPLPYPRYDFILHVTPEARGGLEHRCGTTLATPWPYFEDPTQRPDLLSLFAHEHFHSYNGRRLAPVSLQHIDFEKENYTDALWVIEGFTSYFDELNTLGAGGMTQAQWLQRTGESLTRLQHCFGRTRQSLTEASYDAWIRLYRPYEHTRNQTVSYYLKGSLVAMAIDLAIRAHSEGEQHLAHVLQQLWTQWHDHGVHYTTEDVLRQISTVVPHDVAMDIRAWVETTIDPPFTDLLATHGVLVEHAVSEPPVVGITFQTTGESAIITSIDETHADAFAGLLPGDEIIAVDGRRVYRHNVVPRLAVYADASQRCEVTAVRLGRLFTCTIRVPVIRCVQLRVDQPQEHSTPARLRARWLGEDA